MRFYTLLIITFIYCQFVTAQEIAIGDVGGQNDLSRINMNNIERIEIVKGAVSSLYGPDAIRGAINFISKMNKDKFSISNTLQIGEHGDVSQNNNIVEPPLPGVIYMLPLH